MSEEDQVHTKEIDRASWPSPEQYRNVKEGFLQDHSYHFQEHVATIPVLQDCSPEQISAGNILLGSFLFGISMTYDICRFSDRRFQIDYDSSKRKAYGTVGYEPKSDAFRMNIDRLEPTLRIAALSPNYWISAHNFRGKIIDGRDEFELAGVEEARHRIRYRTKRSWGKPPIKHPDRIIAYHTSESEEDGLLWCREYARRYLPNHFQDYDTLYTNVQEALRAKRRLPLLENIFKQK